MSRPSSSLVWLVRSLCVVVGCELDEGSRESLGVGLLWIFCSVSVYLFVFLPSTRSIHILTGLLHTTIMVIMTHNLKFRVPLVSPTP